MKKKSNKTIRGILIGTGTTLIMLGVAVLGMSLWEAFGGLKSKFIQVQLPGFHQLELDSAGLYGGVYQHQGPGPMPTSALSRLDVRLMAKDTYQEIPVLLNTTGQTFSRFGVQGMPLFNFAIQNPGSYTLSAVYLEGDPGPTVPVTIIAQAVTNVKQTLIAGALFFGLFIGLGIYVLVKLNTWAPED